MRIAIFSDVHGNLTALEAVLEDIAQRNVEGAFSLGDLVGYGPRPNEVAAKMEESEIEGVVGNYDLAICHPDAVEGMAKYLLPPQNEVARRTFMWTHACANQKTRDYLAKRPAQFWIEEGEHKILLTHASPEAPNEYLFPDIDEARLVELFEGTGATVMVVGHTHLPQARAVGENLLLNPGSVGRPKDGDPRASYLIIDTEGGFRAEHVRVTFNVESVAQDCVESGLPVEQAEGLRKGLSA